MTNAELKAFCDAHDQLCAFWEDGSMFLLDCVMDAMNEILSQYPDQLKEIGYYPRQEA